MGFVVRPLRLTTAITTKAKPLCDHRALLRRSFQFICFRFVSLPFGLYTANLRRSLSNMQGRLVVHGNAEAGTALLRFSNMQSECLFGRTTNILSCIERGFCIRYCILCLQVRNSLRPPVAWGPEWGK